MNRKFDILTVLDTCVDLLVDLGGAVPEFGQKEKFINGFQVEMGGSSCIFAAQAAKLGLKVAGIGVVGCDAFGDVVFNSLTAANVDTSMLLKDNRQQTGLGILLCRGSDRAILTYNGTIDAVSPSIITDEVLSSARHLHIGSYYLMKRLRPHWPDIVKRAKSLGLTVSLDTNWDPDEKWEGVEELLPYVDVFLPNKNEICHLSGKDSFEDAMACFRGKVEVLAVKMGEQGGLSCVGDGIVRQPAIRMEVVDTVGAGDSFDGGFLSGWLSGQPLETCLKMGCFTGAMNTRRAGGTKGQADKKELADYLVEK